MLKIYVIRSTNVKLVLRKIEPGYEEIKKEDRQKLFTANTY